MGGVCRSVKCGTKRLQWLGLTQLALPVQIHVETIEVISPRRDDLKDQNKGHWEPFFALAILSSMNAPFFPSCLFDCAHLVSWWIQGLDRVGDESTVPYQSYVA